MAAFEVIALDTATPQLRAPGAADTYTFPRAVEMPLGTANGVLYLNGSKVVTSGSGLTFASNLLAAPNMQVSGVGNYLYFDTTSGAAANYIRTVNDFDMRLYCGRGSTSYTDITTDGIRWGIAASEQMRLTSTGLGIGTSSPSSFSGYTTVSVNNATNGGIYNILVNGTETARLQAYSGIFNVAAKGAATNLTFETNGAERMRLDSSGNLGLGVTPSGWSGVTALEIAASGAIASNNNTLDINANAYYNAGYKYIRSQSATRYTQTSGAHQWFTAPSGTAGNAISFTQAMTLDASGRLLIGQTADKTLEVVRVSGSGQASLLLDNTGKTNGSFVGVFNDAALFGVNRNPSTGVFYNASNYAAEIVAVGSSSTSYITFGTAAAANTAPTERARIPAAGGMVVGTAALATTATDGFLYVPTCAGTPTGTPTTQTGTAPIVVDTTNNKLYFYSNAAWRDAGP